MTATFCPSLATLELVDARAQVCDQSLHRGLRERAHGLGVPTECCGPALLRQQVDRERREPVGGEARGDRADVVGQAAVLVDHEHRALRLLRRRPRALQLPVRSVEANDRRRRWGRARGPSSTCSPRFGARARARARAVVTAACGEQRRRTERADPEEPETPHRLPAREVRLRVVGDDLLHQIALHRHAATVPRSSDDKHRARRGETPRRPATPARDTPRRLEGRCKS